MADYGNSLGQQLGSYCLVQLIARGNFADVYLGEHTPLSTLAAIKILHTELAGEEVEKFLAQARTFSSLNHPHIVRVLEFGTENNTPFLAMDYAANGTLRQLHPRGTRLPLSTVVTYVKQIADALQYVHDQNLVHRDIKPHNMLLGPNYEILLGDFGIAIVSQSIGYQLQKNQEFEGTILYAAPEQIRGRPRIASDQYALGVVVYEWLTGSCPFYGSIEEIARQHTLSPPPPLREKVPTTSLAVEQVVLKALAKDPNERFESVQEFAKALERASRPGQPGMGTRQTSPPSLPPSSPLPPKTSSPGTTTPTPQVVTLLTYHGHSDRIHALAWSPDSQLIASSSLDETVQLWKALTGDNVLTYRGNSLQAQAITWSPDGKFIASTSGLLSETVHIWDTSTGHSSPIHATYAGHTESIQDLAWSPDSHDSHDSQLIASSSLDETVQLWKALTGDNVLTYRGNSLQAQAITWSPDGKFIASTSGLLSDTVHIWDTSTGHSSPKHATYAGHAESIQALAWSPDGKFIASASDDATVQVWNASTGRTIFTYRGHRLGVKTVAWSPDGKRITSGSEDKTVQVWDAATGGNIVAYYAHGDKVNSLTWSPGGTHIASASDDATVQVWDASTGRKVFTYSGHTASVTGVAWSPDGIRIASSSLDETVQLWHSITGHPLFTYSGHSDWVSTVAWSPDGQHIASGSWDKTVQIWKI